MLILGQDPYHGPRQAHGLCFSVRRGVGIPPSLANIHRELQTDLGIAPPDHGNLEAWAVQGVLLLNTTLTVRAGQAASHQGHGWETFTDEVIRAVAAKDDHVVFVLWGSHARKKRAFIDTKRHTIIESAHPSPLSAHNGFFGSPAVLPSQRGARRRRSRPDRLAPLTVLCRNRYGNPYRIIVRTGSGGSDDAGHGLEVSRGAPDEHGVLTGLHDPVAVDPRRERPPIEVDVHPLLAAVAQVDPAEPGELPSRPVVVAFRRLDVDLDDLGAGARTRCS